MSANISETKAVAASPVASSATPPIPKRITNAQTVCNERNEKNKLCNGHLKQLKTAGEPAEVHLRGDDVLFKCQICGTLYMGPPLGHVRDPDKQRDRKSTRLNSSHSQISYAVFCLKKKKTSKQTRLCAIRRPVGQPRSPPPSTQALCRVRSVWALYLRILLAARGC